MIIIFSCLLFAIGALIGSAVGGDGFIYIIGLEVMDITGIEAIAIMKLTSFILSVYAISTRILKNKQSTEENKLPDIKKYALLWMISSLIGSYITTLCSEKAIFIFIAISSTLMLIYKIYNIKNGHKKIKKVISNEYLMKYHATLISFYIGFFGPGGGSFFIFIATMFTSMSIKNIFFTNRSIIMIGNIMPVIFFAIKGIIRYDVTIYLAISAIIGYEISARIIEINKNAEKILSTMLIFILFFMSIKYFHKVLII